MLAADHTALPEPRELDVEWRSSILDLTPTAWRTSCYILWNESGADFNHSRCDIP